MPRIYGLNEGSRQSDDIEMMENITYLMSKSKMSYFEIMKLPYAVFLSLLKHFRLFDIQSTPEGRELLAKSNRLYQTEPDLDKLRNSGFYQKG